MGVNKLMTMDFWAPPMKNGSVGKYGSPRRSSLRLRVALFAGGFAFVYMVCQAVMVIGDFEDWPEAGPRRKTLANSSIVAVINNDEDCQSPFDTTFGPVFYLVATLYTFLGLAIVCDEYFVESLDAISNFLHLSEDVAGATFMAAGSSAPELFTAIITILINPGDEGLGTIVGSAVFNIMVIVGVTAIFAGQTLDIWWYPLCRDSMVYALSIVELVLFIAVVTEGQIDWWEGLILVFTYVFYLVIMVMNGKIVKFLGEVELNRQRRIKLAKKQKEKEKEEKEREEREKKLIEEELLKADQAKKDEEESSKKEEADDNNAAALGLTKWGAFRNRKVAPEQRVEESEMTNPVEGDGAEGAAPAEASASGEAGDAGQNEESAPGEGNEAAGAEAEKEDESKDVGAFDENGFEINKDNETTDAPEGEKAGAEAEAGADSSKEKKDDEEITEEAKPEGEETKSDEVIADEEEEKKRQEEALAKINNIFAKAAQARKEKKENDAPANPMLALLRAAADNDGAAPGANAPTEEKKKGGKKKDIEDEENPFGDRIGVNPLYRKEFKPTFDKHAKTERMKAREDLQMKFTTAIVVESVATKWLEKIGKRRSTQEEIAKRKAEEEAKLKEEEEEENEGIMSKIQGWALFIISFPYLLAMKFTIPDCRKDMFKKWFMITFIMSIFWIGLLSYFMVEFASRLGCIFGIPDLIMGLTIIAAGTSVPDALSSIVVAQNGQGDMAVANVLGSNVFNILLGLGFPWFLAVAFTGFEDPFAVASDDVVEPVVLLFVYLFLFIGIIGLAGWRLFPAIGYVLISLDVVFIVYSCISAFCGCVPWKNY